jgi:hypothetical protein
MKKLLIATAAMAMMAGSAMAVNQANTGVGVGTMIFENSDGKLYEILAITTNGTLTNNLMGITSGTLGYQGDRGWVSVEKVRDYVNGNMEALAMDISRGEGESLASLEELMAVSDTAKFRSDLQKNFSSIYTSDDVSGDTVLLNIAKVSKA